MFLKMVLLSTWSDKRSEKGNRVKLALAGAMLAGLAIGFVVARLGERPYRRFRPKQSRSRPSKRYRNKIGTSRVPKTWHPMRCG
jgi:hypothetical protein